MPTQAISQLSLEELLHTFVNEKSNRMQVCKAGERILQENIILSEQVYFKIYFHIANERSGESIICKSFF